MAEQYVSPWVKAVSGKPGPCHYGCGQPAAMTEPGKPWKAHKVCAEGNPSTGPLGNYDGGDRESKLEAKPLGCGEPAKGQTSGRVCAGLGTTPSCQLCPSAPNYWRLTDGCG